MCSPKDMEDPVVLHFHVPKKMSNIERIKPGIPPKKEQSIKLQIYPRGWRRDLHTFTNFCQFSQCWYVYLEVVHFVNHLPQHAEWDLNKIDKTFNGTFTG